MHNAGCHLECTCFVLIDKFCFPAVGLHGAGLDRAMGAASGSAGCGQKPDVDWVLEAAADGFGERALKPKLVAARNQSTAGAFGLARETRLGGVSAGAGLAASSGACADMRAGRLADAPNRAAFSSSSPSTSQKSQ
jgi:hypothetical protein